MLAGVRIVVTGGTGFLGSHLARALVEAGAHVHLIIRPTSQDRYPDVMPSGLPRHRHMGGMDSMLAIFAEVRPQLVFHLASLFISDEKSSDVDPLIESNVRFGVELLQAMSAVGCDAMVAAGTGWQHYHSPAARSVNLYAATKQAFESIAGYYCDRRGLRFASLLLNDTYGAGDRRNKLFAYLRRAVKSGGWHPMTEGRQLIDLVHVRDVVRAFLYTGAMLLRTAAGSCCSYSVTSGHLLSLREVVELYASLCGKSLSIQWGGSAYRKREVMTPVCGDAPPDWHPLISLEDGLREMIARDA